MAIKAKTLVIGGKLVASEQEKVKREPTKSPQDKVKVGLQVKRPEPEPVRREPPQDMAIELDEPKPAGVKNSFILKSSSKFHRDMIEE